MTYNKKIEKAMQEIEQENEFPQPLPTFGSVSTDITDVYVPTGFTKLDTGLGGGLVKGVAYLLAAVEKAGKSSFLRRMVFQMLSLGYKVAFIDIEQSSEFALKSMTASAKEKNISQVTKRDMEDFVEFSKDKLFYITRSNSGNLIQDEDGSLSVKRCINTLTNAVKDYKCDVLVFDNVTPFASEGDKATHTTREKIMAELIKLAPKTNVVVLVVGHVNEATREHKKDTYLEKILESGTPEKAMDEGTTIVRKPTGKDLFGGTILTQFGGKLYLWRPYQSDRNEHNQKFAWLIVSSARYSKDFSVSMEFMQGTYSFKEKDWSTEDKPLFNRYSDK